jgi:hypothetical protein
VRDGRIAWRIELFVAWDWGAEDVLYRPSIGRVPLADGVGELRRVLPEARHWILSQPVDESFLWNLLCVGLVPIADIDPEFAKRALDPETWRAIVLGDCGIDGETRALRLRVIDGYFHCVLNNALLHVMGSLACNHFEVVTGLLDHPARLGGYTSMMPHYLFAVLLEQVKVLHAIATRDD